MINGTLVLRNGEAMINGFLHVGPAPKLF